MDMARRARAAAAAQREQLVEARVADILHNGQARVAFDLMLGPVARHDNQLGHASPSSVSCRRRYVARCATNQPLLSASLGTKGEDVMGCGPQHLHGGIAPLSESTPPFTRPPRPTRPPHP